MKKKIIYLPIFPYGTLAIFCKKNLNRSNYKIYMNYPDKYVQYVY